MADLSRIVILTEGNTEPLRAKTAASVIRYRPAEVVALLDSTNVGKTTQELLEVGGDTPVVASLDAVPDADTLLIGIAPTGGKIPSEWRPLILEAIKRGMKIVSGLHDFFSDDAEFSSAAKEHGVELFDIRKNDEKDVADAHGFRAECTRIETVGQDCCVGKMVTAIEVAKGLKQAGHSTKFAATGQTGIMIEGDGCPVDCVVSDFLNGAVEKLIRANEHHDFVVIEGQGSLAHPLYSPVTLGLLHGAQPQGLILCYEAARRHMHSVDHCQLLPLAMLRDAYEVVADLVAESKVIGVGVNSRRLSDDEALRECDRVESELGVPACDVVRHGPEKLVNASIELRRALTNAT